MHAEVLREALGGVEMGANVFHEVHNIIGGLMCAMLGESDMRGLGVPAFAGWEAHGGVAEMDGRFEEETFDAGAETLEGGYSGY